MKPIALEPDRIELAPGLQVPRLITGLWQVADMERGGRRCRSIAQPRTWPTMRAPALMPLTWQTTTAAPS